MFEHACFIIFGLLSPVAFLLHTELLLTNRNLPQFLKLLTLNRVQLWVRSQYSDSPIVVSNRAARGGTRETLVKGTPARPLQC